MRLFIYICISFCSLIYSSENESFGDKKAADFLTATELESLKAMIPENLRYEIPEIPNNSFLDLQEFLKDKDAPRFSDQDRQTIQSIEDFKKVSSKELQNLVVSLNKQKQDTEQFYSILSHSMHLSEPPNTKVVPVYDLSHFRSAVRYYSIRSLVCYRMQQFELALEELGKTIQVIKKLEERKGGILDQLTVAACKDLLFSRLNSMLKSKKLSLLYLQELEQLLNGIITKPVVLEDMMRYEIQYLIMIMYETPQVYSEFVVNTNFHEFTNKIKQLSKSRQEEIFGKNITTSTLREIEVFCQFFIFHHVKISQLALSISQAPVKSKDNAFKNYIQTLDEVESSLLDEYFSISGKTQETLVKVTASRENHRQALLLIAAIRKYELKYKRTPKSFKDMIAGAVLTDIPKDMWTGKNLNVDIKKRYIEFDAVPKDKTKKCYF